MRISKYFLILSVLLLAACGQKETATTETTTATPTQEPPANAPQGQQVTNINEAYGISNEPGNVLGGLRAGDTAPGFSLKNQNGKTFTLQNALKKGPVVMVFYRGFWCEVCNRYLEHFEQNLAKVTARGATVVAITPEEGEFVARTQRRTGTSLSILSDTDHKIMEAYKVKFSVTDNYRHKIFNTAQHELMDINNDKDESILPIPAVYIIGQDGIIDKVWYNPDFRHRPRAAQILSVLDKG